MPISNSPIEITDDLVANVPNDAVVVASNFSFAFAKKNDVPTWVIRHISMDIRQGTITSIVGPSGCGKTTLLRCFAGLLPKRGHGMAVDGSLLVLGETPLDAMRAKLVSIAFQNPVLLPWRSAAENVSIPLELDSTVSASEIATRSSEILRLVGLSEKRNVYPSHLSGGMRQRVSLGRSLVRRPKLLLLDEPFSALDDVSRELLNDELLRIQRAMSLTVILVTHNLREAVLLSDHVIVIGDTNRHPPRQLVIPREAFPRNQEAFSSGTFHELVDQLKSDLRGVSESTLT